MNPPAGSLAETAAPIERHRDPDFRQAHPPPAPPRHAAACRPRHPDPCPRHRPGRRAVRRPRAGRRRQDRHPGPIAGASAAATGPPDPAAGLLPARSRAGPPRAGHQRHADTAAGAGPAAGGHRPGGAHQRQHRGGAAAGRRHRHPAQRVGLRRRARRGRRRPGCAPQPHRHQDRHGAQRDPADHQRGHRAAGRDDRRHRHQPGAALRARLLQLWLGQPLRLVLGPARLHPHGLRRRPAGAQHAQPGQLARRSLPDRQHHRAARPDLGAVRPGRPRRHRRRAEQAGQRRAHPRDRDPGRQLRPQAAQFRPRRQPQRGRHAVVPHPGRGPRRQRPDRPQQGPARGPGAVAALAAQRRHQPDAVGHLPGRLGRCHQQLPARPGHGAAQPQRPHLARSLHRRAGLQLLPQEAVVARLRAGTQAGFGLDPAPEHPPDAPAAEQPLGLRRRPG
ncbi:Uncharacterised protein [Achromobacter sp. 2789STDY5608621]|nr:Uncharacterised protein [Achromobacter sp. 2789STDY5608621]